MNAETACRRAVIEFELAERNGVGLRNWQLRQALRPLCMDAYNPFFRECLTRWFEGRRQEARRWLFQRSCARRKIDYIDEWSPERVPAFLKRQAE